MLVALIEEKITAALTARLAAQLTDARGGASFRIYGSWNPADAFTVKNEEDEKAVLQIGVALSTFGRPTFTAPQMTLNGAINLAVRFDLDPTGSAFLAAAESIDNLLQEWQGETYQALFTDLDIQNEMGETVCSVDNISINPATPSFDATTSTTNLTFTFTLSGTIN